MKHAQGKSNIDIVRGYLSGDRPFTTVGWTDDLSKRKEGEKWVDSKGRHWVKSRGYKKRINNPGKVSSETARMLCSMCERDMKWGNYLDDKIFPKTGRCYDCNSVFESKLKVDGKFADYEKIKVLKNQLGFCVDFKSKLEETIHHLETSTDDIVYLNEDGSKEVWKDTTRLSVLEDAKNDMKECILAIARIHESLKGLGVS
jgi:hypothetical protein